MHTVGSDSGGVSYLFLDWIETFQVPAGEGH